MHEKLREAATALRAAAEDCHQRFMAYRDLADRLDAVTNLQPAAATHAAKQPHKIRRVNGKAPSAPVTRRNGRPPRISDETIVATVNAGTGLTMTEIAHKLGVEKAESLWGRLKRLADEGRITKGGDQKYRKTVAQAAAVN